jgi:pimeloyl-ACP methyl ester carboxylesterase
VAPPHPFADLASLAAFAARVARHAEPGVLTGGAAPLTVEPGLRALDVGEARVEYVVLGESLPADAPAVVILHGGNCSADDWSAIAPRLARRYRVIVPDGLVHPLDPWRIWLLLDHLGVDRAGFIAHSAGGMVWRTMYRLQSHRVSGLCAIDTQGPGKTINARELPHDRFSPPSAAVYAARRDAMQALKPHHRGDYPSDVNLAARNVAYRRALMSADARAATRPAPRALESFAGPLPTAPAPLSDEGKFITCPVQIFHTGRGKLGPEDLTPAWIDQNIQARDVEYIVIRETSHWPWLEDPAGFLSRLEPFLARRVR